MVMGRKGGPRTRQSTVRRLEAEIQPSEHVAIFSDRTLIKSSDTGNFSTILMKIFKWLLGTNPCSRKRLHIVIQLLKV